MLDCVPKIGVRLGNWKSQPLPLPAQEGDECLGTLRSELVAHGVEQLAFTACEPHLHTDWSGPEPPLDPGKEASGLFGFHSSHRPRAYTQSKRLAARTAGLRTKPFGNGVIPRRSIGLAPALRRARVCGWQPKTCEQIHFFRLT